MSETMNRGQFKLPYVACWINTKNSMQIYLLWQFIHYILLKF